MPDGVKVNIITKCADTIEGLHFDWEQLVWVYTQNGDTFCTGGIWSGLPLPKASNCVHFVLTSMLRKGVAEAWLDYCTLFSLTNLNPSLRFREIDENHFYIDTRTRPCPIPLAICTLENGYLQKIELCLT